MGFLVYQGEELVGWTGSGPKTAFPLLKDKLGSRLSDFSKRYWSIGCVALKQEFRGKGYAEKIVSAVLAEATASGAILVESYPVRPFDEPRSYRGSYPVFARSGFTEKGSEKDGEFDVLLMQRQLALADP